MIDAIDVIDVIARLSTIINTTPLGLYDIIASFNVGGELCYFVAPIKCTVNSLSGTYTVVVSVS